MTDKEVYLVPVIYANGSSEWCSVMERGRGRARRRRRHYLNYCRIGFREVGKALTLEEYREVKWLSK
jgi:hypothetical protein